MKKTMKLDLKNLLNHPETLKSLGDLGIIKSSDVEQLMKTKEEILAKHPYKIYKTDGRWCTYVKDITRKNGRRQIARKSKAELETALLEFYLGGSCVEKCTLRSLKPEWMEYKARHVKPTTMMKVVSDWRRYYEDDPITDIPLSELDVITLDIWIHDMIKNHEMDKRKYHNFASIINQIMEYAVLKELLEENTFKRVHVDGRKVFVKKRKKRSRDQALRPEELGKLWELALEDYRNETKDYVLAPLALLFQFYTGLRISEVTALRHEDVIEHNMLSVGRMLQRDTGDIIEATKGDKEEPNEILLVSCARLLIQLAKDYKREHGYLTDEYIFSLGIPGIGIYRSISELYPKYSEKLGIPRMTSHSARRTYASISFNNGMSEEFVRKALNHNKIYMFKDHYLYDTNSDDDNLRKLEEAFASSMPESVQKCANTGETLKPA